VSPLQLEPSVATRKRCKGTKKDGAACMAWATEGGLCYFHANPNKAVELGRSGGLRRQHTFEQPTEPVAPPESAADVRKMLAETMAGAFSSHSAHPQFAHRAGSPSAGCSLVVGSASAHADITLPATAELGAVSRRRIGGSTRVTVPAPTSPLGSRLFRHGLPSWQRPGWEPILNPPRRCKLGWAFQGLPPPNPYPYAHFGALGPDRRESH